MSPAELRSHAAQCRLVAERLDGRCRSVLIEAADDYERQAMQLERLHGMPVPQHVPKQARR